MTRSGGGRPTLVWFRHDLRVDDNPALRAAVEHGGPVIPVFVWSPDEEGRWAPASASRWWLHQSLRVLHDELERRGAALTLRRGPARRELESLIQETGADAVFWNRRYEPAVVARDTEIKRVLHQSGIEAESFNGALLVEPWEVETKQGKPYQVFTPFWRAAQERLPTPPPLAAPRSLAPPEESPSSLTLDQLQLEPTIDWAAGMREAWTPGCAGAMQQLKDFAKRVGEYASARDLPASAGTSRLSPHLHFGEVSPRRVWSTLSAADDAKPQGLDVYRKELGWREFAHHLLFHFPQTPDRPLRESFAAFPWRNDPSGLRAWQRGQTGYPIVDAGMRQLWRTGWMHNRVRMIVASFLAKDLRISWQEGAAWFWDTLVDADLANNTLGWQWTAGCGADAAPYFRIFNPVTQSRKFDPDGAYLREWIPELRRLPSKWIHAPWEAPEDVLESAKVALGEDYPEPIVDHAAARTEALAAFETLGT